MEIGKTAKQVLQSGTIDNRLADEIVASISSGQTTDAEGLEQVEDLLLALSAGQEIHFDSIDNRRRVIDALRQVQRSNSDAPQVNLKDLNEEELTPEAIRSLSLATKVSILEQILIKDWIVGDDSEQLVINVIDSMNSKQLSIALIELHRNDDSAKELYEDFHFKQYDVLCQRLTERLVELDPQAGAIVLARVLQKSGQADEAIRHLYASGKRGERAAKDILGAMITLGLKFPKSAESGPVVIVNGPNGVSVAGPGGASVALPGGGRITTVR